MVRVVDIFAGPGGLGEGFSAYYTDEGQVPFKIALSIEKDICAHRTLTLRSFFRQFEAGKAPKEYYDYLRQLDEPESLRTKRLFAAWPEQARRAEETAFLAELGAVGLDVVRERIRKALAGDDEFVLLGGPPCQAYSIMGRSRNKGNPQYRPSEDKRNRLYVEYLQILADHHPAVFIMENVKGLLSAAVGNQQVFERIVEDLHSPCEAILREGRELADARRRTRYTLFALGRDKNGRPDDMRRFIVQMEKHGIPQARHRLIILGVRSDMGVDKMPPLGRTRSSDNRAGYLRFAWCSQRPVETGGQSCQLARDNWANPRVPIYEWPQWRSPSGGAGRNRVGPAICCETKVLSRRRVRQLCCTDSLSRRLVC